MAEEIKISTDTITLGQLLKLANVIDTGGMAKWFLHNNEVYVNGELENRRGRKLKHADVVEIQGHGTFIVASLE